MFEGLFIIEVAVREQCVEWADLGFVNAGSFQSYSRTPIGVRLNSSVSEQLCKNSIRLSCWRSSLPSSFYKHFQRAIKTSKGIINYKLYNLSLWWFTLPNRNYSTLGWPLTFSICPYLVCFRLLNCFQIRFNRVRRAQFQRR